MATPLRKASNYGYTLPSRSGHGQGRQPLRTPERRSVRRTQTDTSTSRRLVSRQIRSNAESRRTLAWLFGTMSTVLFVMLIAAIFVKTNVSRMNYDLSSIELENEQLLHDTAKIRGQIAELRSLDTIQDRAITELGMVKSEAVEYMVLSTTIVSEGKVKTEEEAQGEAEDEPVIIESALNILLELMSK